MDWRFRLLDIATWQEAGFLPVRNCTVSWKRGAGGRMDASLPLWKGLVPVRPGEQMLVVEQNRLPIWGGIVWAVDFDSRSGYAVMRGSEWATLLARRRVREDLTFTTETREEGWDQFEIARQLVWHAQAGRSFPADLHIDPWAGYVPGTAPDSGRTRDRSYLALDRKQVLEAVQQLSEVRDGFEWALRPRYREDELEFWLEFTYPAASVHSDLVLEYRQGWPGSSVVGYTWPWDGSSMVNRAEAGNEEEVRTVEDPTAWPTYPLLEDVVNMGGEGGVTRSDTLEEHAQALLDQERRPRTGGALTLRSDIEVWPELVGQQVRVRLSSWRHPEGPHGEPGFDEDLVIEEMQLSLPSDERPATVTLQVASREWLGLRHGSAPGGASVRDELVGLLNDLQSGQNLLWAAMRRRGS